jgi:hypothetical protein
MSTNRLTWMSGSHYAELRAWEAAQARRRTVRACLVVVEVFAVVALLAWVLS